MSELKPVIGSPWYYLIGAIIGAGVALAADLPWWAASAIGAGFYVIATTISRHVAKRNHQAV